MQAQHGKNAHRKNWKDSGLKPKDLCGIPWRVAFALQADGWYLRSDIIWSKPNPMPESVTDRPTKSHEYLFLLTKQPRYYYDADAVREPHKESWRGKGELEKYDDYQTTDRDLVEGRQFNRAGVKVRQYNPAGRNRRTVWQIATQPFSGAHFATFPEALVEPCIRAGTSEHGCCPACGKGWVRVVEKKLIPGGGGKPKKVYNIKDCLASMNNKTNFIPGTNRITTLGWQPACKCQRDDVVPALVLDPFCGSGTSLVVARKLGRRGVGTDLSYPYLRDQARARLGLDKLDAWRNGRNKVETKLTPDLQRKHGVLKSHLIRIASLTTAYC